MDLAYLVAFLFVTAPENLAALRRPLIDKIRELKLALDGVPFEKPDDLPQSITGSVGDIMRYIKAIRGPDNFPLPPKPADLEVFDASDKARYRSRLHAARSSRHTAEQQMLVLKRVAATLGLTEKDVYPDGRPQVVAAPPVPTEDLPPDAKDPEITPVEDKPVVVPAPAVQKPLLASQPEPVMVPEVPAPVLVPPVVEEPKVEEPKVEVPEVPVVEEPKVEEPKVEVPEVPVVEEPEVEVPEVPKTKDKPVPPPVSKAEEPAAPSAPSRRKKAPKVPPTK